MILQAHDFIWYKMKMQIHCNQHKDLVALHIHLKMVLLSFFLGPIIANYVYLICVIKRTLKDCIILFIKQFLENPSTKILHLYKNAHIPIWLILIRYSKSAKLSF